MFFSDKEWHADRTSPGVVHLFPLSGTLVDQQTAFQRIEIVENEIFGRMLILDGELQSAAFDEHRYHEALVHPAMVLHPSPRRVLIAGGGEGATAREALRHESVSQLVMVDIDGEVVELCRLHLPQWHGNCYDDPRMELYIGDVLRLLEDRSDRYDVIILDLTEPDEDGPAHHLATRQFYQLVRDRLSPEGIVAMQAGDFNPVNLRTHTAAYTTLKEVFPHVASYRVFVPSFHTEWGFLLASPHHPVERSAEARQEIADTIAARKLELRFYNADVHCGMFCSGMR